MCIISKALPVMPTADKPAVTLRCSRRFYHEWPELQVHGWERSMMKFYFMMATAVLAAAMCTAVAALAQSDEQPGAKAAAKGVADTPDGLVKLSATNDVWLDTKRKAVVVDGQVCLREGQLEMFACPKGTKEHESVVSLNCKSEEVHAGLLAAGAKQGRPVRFDPNYQAATGQIIDIYVLWKDAQGAKQQVRAQEWIKSAKTGKALAYDWVFAGSGFWKDEETGKEHYRANGGELVCVSNFPNATLDLPIESSEANAELLFSAFADRIPERGTKVRLVFIPRVEKRGSGEKDGP